MQEERFTCFRLFYEIGQSIQDSETRLKYYEALFDYGLNGNKPSDPIINSLLVGPIYSIDKSKNIRTRKNENIANSMKGNQNAVKNFEKVSKQLKTVGNSGKQLNSVKTDRSIEDNNIILYNNILNNNNLKKEDNKLSSKEKKTLSSVELVRAYEQNELLVRKIHDSEAVKGWTDYKQAKKDRAYKTESGFIQQLVGAVKKIEFGMPRADVGERLKFATNIASEKEWKDIYRTNEIEESYQSFKRFSSIQNQGATGTNTQHNE